MSERSYDGAGDAVERSEPLCGSQAIPAPELPNAAVLALPRSSRREKDSDYRSVIVQVDDRSADYSYLAARMDWSDRLATAHLDKLEGELKEAERQLVDAEHALRCFQAMLRANALEAS